MRIVGIGYKIAEIVVAGISDILNIAVIAIVVVVAGLTGAEGTVGMSNIAGRALGGASGRALDRTVVIRKAGVFAVCATLIAISPTIFAREVGAVHYMVTLSKMHLHITRANKTTSTGPPRP